MSVHAFAVQDKGGINIRTVSPTRIAAMVNWLLVEARVLILRGSPDAEVERLWEKYRDGAELVPVTVAVTL